MKTTAVTGAAILLAAGITTIGVKKFTAPSIESYFTHMDSEYLNTAPPMVLLRPSRYLGQGGYIVTTRPNPHSPGKVMRRDCAFTAVLATAYDFDMERIILPVDAPPGQFDLLLTVPDHPAEALRKDIKKQFGLVGDLEARDTDVLVLRVSNPAASGLKVSTEHNEFGASTADGKMTTVNYKMSDVAYSLGASYFKMPVIDETKLTNSYDFELRWNSKVSEDGEKDEIKRAMREQLGLELVSTNMPIEMLVMKKVQ